MNELLQLEAWLQTLDFSGWTTHELEQRRWVQWRNSSIFDSQLGRVRALVGEQRKIAVFLRQDHLTLASIRTTAFEKVTEVAGSNELAAYVMDDFELLAQAARVGFQDEWLDKLRAEYEAGRFPHGSL